MFVPMSIDGKAQDVELITESDGVVRFDVRADLTPALLADRAVTVELESESGAVSGRAVVEWVEPGPPPLTRLALTGPVEVRRYEVGARTVRGPLRALDEPVSKGEVRAEQFDAAVQELIRRREGER